MNFTPLKEVRWKEVQYLKEPLEASPEHAIWKYKLKLPLPLADWDVFDYWEKERIASMEQHLKNGDVLFDIGTESGWCNIVYAQIVGPENMVLIEPTKEFWPNIKATWEKNFGKVVKPKGTLSALLSNKTTANKIEAPGNWPDESLGSLIDRNKYQYIHEKEAGIEEITLDEWVRATGIIPTALTMDTEGSELLILKGAEQTLRKFHPQCWISIHPDLSERDYSTTKENVLDFMKNLRYKAEHLATDHEEHWRFYV